MSLITLIPVGSKTRCISVLPSSTSSNFNIVTGSWDSDLNSLKEFTLSFDIAVMDEAADLESSKFLFENTETMKDVDGDINCIQMVDEKDFIYGTSSGNIVLQSASGRSLQDSHNESCVSLDILNGRLLSAFADGKISLSNIELMQESNCVKLSFGAMPTSCKWLNESELMISTRNSKIQIFDERTMSKIDEILFSDRLSINKPLVIRAIDVDRDVADWLICSGDDEGFVKFWDRRNLQQPLAQTQNGATRNAVTAVKLHRSLPNHVVSGSADGSIILHSIDGGDLIEAWRMPASLSPCPVNCLDMVGSLVVAGLDNANSIAWRMN